MKVKVGLPRALLFYQYYPLWRAFFEALGAEVVTSPPTTRATLAAGAARVVADMCLPVKVYCGHVLDLVDQVDVLFIPSVRSLERHVHNCSKLLGLPDLVRAVTKVTSVIKPAPEIVDIDIDLEKGRLAFYRAVYQAGCRFTRNPWRVRAAFEAAWAAHLRYLDRLHAGVPVEDAVDQGFAASAHQGDLGQPSGHLGDCRDAVGEFDGWTATTTVAVIGHWYNLFDRYANHDVLRRLERLGVAVRTSAQVTETAARDAIARRNGRLYWTCEADVVGAASYFCDEPRVDGIVAVVAFGCGPDSVMLDIVRRRARAIAKPFMLLTIDEHTSAAGIQTRLEAFVDMLARRRSIA